MSDHIVAALLSSSIVLWTNNSIQNRYLYSIMYNSYYGVVGVNGSPDYDLMESSDVIKDYMFQRLTSRQQVEETVS